VEHVLARERPGSQQRHFLQAPKDVFVCSVLIYVQRIRRFTTMRYVDVRFACLLSSYLHHLVSVQPARSTRSSFLNHQPSSSPLYQQLMTGLHTLEWNEHVASLSRRHSSFSISDSRCPVSSSSVDSLLYSVIAQSLLHSTLETCLFHTSCPS